MRRFNFNKFKKTESNKPTPQGKTQYSYSAYRTVISRHDAVEQRLKDEPVAIINGEN